MEFFSGVSYDGCIVVGIGGLLVVWSCVSVVNVVTTGVDVDVGVMFIMFWEA